MIKVNPLILLQVEHTEATLSLYPHQAVMLDEWERHKTFGSQLMTLREHIFVIVPKIVEDELALSHLPGLCTLTGQENLHWSWIW